MDVKIKLDMFEGPLDLLLHLIERAEVDIYEVPIARITDQYMEYLSAMQEWEMEIASEFLVMAATLLAIKSRMLLPRQEPLETDRDEFAEWEEEADPREELIERLLEYKKYKKLADVLREHESRRSLVYSRPPMDLTAYARERNPLEGIRPDDLLQFFVDVLRQQKESQQVARVSREEVSIGDRISEIIERLRAEGGAVRFSRLVERGRITREWIVTTFLAILELMKAKRIVCRQERLFDDLWIIAAEAKEEGSLGTAGEEGDH